MAATVVIGAGIIGTTTALALARRGFETVVVDGREGAGLETSFANGGLLAGNSALPWSSPGTPRLLFKWLGREDAPLLLRPRAIPGLGRWGLQFLANCRPDKYRQTAAALTQLGRASLAAMDELLDAHGVEAETWRGGFLELFRGEGAATGAETFARFLEGLGAEVERLDPAGVVALEPQLARIGNQIGAALLLKNDRWGNAQSFAVAAAATAIRNGVTFRYGAPVQRLEVSAGKVTAVHAGGERIAAGNVVVCTGPLTPKLLGPLGIRVPIQPVKGYSITLMADQLAFMPSRPIVDDVEHIAITPLGDRLRVAGTVEFAGHDTTLRPGRIANLQRGLQNVFPDLVMPKDVHPWCAFRPMTADGLPIIDHTAIANLYINAGHGALGWSLACGSAELAAGLVSGEPLEAAVPFRLGRSYW